MLVFIYSLKNFSF